jgi:predicted NAD-dependent protein-ADP-ribosyltransferase YbiA (DUF1768 family)
MARKRTRKKKKHVSARRMVREIRKTLRAVEALQEESTPGEAKRLGKKIRKLKKLERDAERICSSFAI